MDIIFKLANFIIFASVLLWFVRRPVREYWSVRHKIIGEGIATVQKTYETVAIEYKKWKTSLKNIEGEISELTKELEREGEMERRRIVEQAKKYADRLCSEARRATVQETSHAIAELKNFVAEIVTDIAKHRLLKETTAQDHNNIVNLSMKHIQESL